MTTTTTTTQLSQAEIERLPGYRKRAANEYSAACPMKYVSLFSGIGGFDLGFDRAGMECVLQVEKDEKARAVLAHHWPNVPRMELVEDVTRDSIRQLGIETVDLAIFGSPCQDLSIQGYRKGLQGQRSSLFFDAIRIVDELKPTFAIWENVPGALSSNSGRDFATVLASFRDIGARDISWRVLDAQYFGVPQRRRRVFLIADFRSERTAQILFETNTKLLQETEKQVVSPTLSAQGQVDNGGGCWAHGMVIITNGKPRRLTPLECERLQGFPEGWTADQDDQVRYRQLGNAVVPYVTEWIGQRITEIGA